VNDIFLRAMTTYLVSIFDSHATEALNGLFSVKNRAHKFNFFVKSLETHKNSSLID